MKWHISSVILAILGNLFCLCLSCCDPRKEEREQTIQERMIEQITYQQDPRTGICFAITGWFWYSRTMTTVPCEVIPKQLLNAPCKIGC